MEEKEIIFGRNPVTEYLKNIKPGTGARLLLSESAHGKIISTIRALAKEKKVAVTEKEKKFFSRFGPSSAHQGVALELSGKREKISIEDFLKSVAEKKGVVAILDHLTDPHNVGAIIRSAEALGLDGIAMPRSDSADITGTVIKSSAGATAHLPVHRVANTVRFIDQAKDAGFWIIGTTDHGDREPGDLADIRPAVIVIGSEGTGMRQLTEDKCDYLVRIPLKGKVSSLNASVAAGILFYEIMKDEN